MKKLFSRTALYLAGIVLLGLVLRLINIGTQPYWGDEVLSLDIARSFSSVHEMLRYLAEVEIHPPLYYLMLRPWTDLFGAAEAATRALSLVFSLGTIVMTFFLGKRLFRDGRVGLVAAFVVALLPLQIQYAQEARPYAMYCFFSVIGMYAVWECCKGVKKDSRVFLVVYAASSIVGMYLHYSYALFLAATASWWLFEVLRGPKDIRSRRFVNWLGVHAVVFLGFYPWLKSMLLKIVLGDFLLYGDARQTTLLRPPDMPLHVFGQLVWSTSYKYVPNVYQIAIVVFILAVIVAIVRVVRTSRPVATEVSDRGDAMFFLAWLFGASLIVFVASPQSIAYAPLYERHILFAAIPLAVLFGALVARLPFRPAAALVALLVCSLTPYVINVVADDSAWDHYYQLAAAGEYINQNYKPGDLVIVSSSGVRTDMTHYLADDVPVVDMLPIDFYGKDFWDGRHVLGFVENEGQSRVRPVSESEVHVKLARLVALYKPKRIWLYSFSLNDYYTHYWFRDAHWRYALRSIADVFQVDLYVAPQTGAAARP